jgi:hypothetical protein
MSKQITEFHNLFFNNQEGYYLQELSLAARPYETDEGKLKYLGEEIPGKKPKVVSYVKYPYGERVSKWHLCLNEYGHGINENGDKIDGSYILEKVNIGKHEVLKKHDLGTVISPLGADGTIKFGALDVDVYDNQKLLEKIVNQIYKEKIPLVPCYSKSGGLHLYLFTSIKIEYSEIKNALEYFKKKLNVAAKELFPKQAKKPNLPGNGIALPYRSTILVYQSNYGKNESWRASEHDQTKLDFHNTKNRMIKADLSLATLDEFLEHAKMIQDTWTREFWDTIPIMQKEKDEIKTTHAATDIKKGSLIRNPSKQTESIIDKILKGEEHQDGGTFDNWVVSLVYSAAVIDLRTDEEIENYFNRVKHKSDKANETDYLKNKIESCRTKYSRPDPGTKIADFLNNIAWDMELDKFFDMRTNKHLSPTSLNRKFNNLFPKKTTPTETFDSYEDKKCVEALMYRPDIYDHETRIIKDGTCTYLNKYIPGTLEPIKPTYGNLKPWLDLINYLFPNKIEREHVLNWLAFVVQNPGVKIRHAIMVYSKDWQIGKGSMFSVLTDILGEDNCEPGSVKSILDKGVTFTEKLVVLIDECRGIGDHNENKKLLNDLKTIITESKIQKRLLYKDFGAAKQFTNFLIFTNNDDALSIDANDPRYFVTENLEKRLDQDFYTNFHKWRQDKGSSYVMWDLLNRNISKFDHTRPPPPTLAKTKMASNSGHVLELDMKQRFDEGQEPFSFAAKVRGTLEVKEWYLENGKSTLQKAATNPKTINMCFERLGFKKIGQVLHKARNEKPTLWLIRNIEELEKKSNTEICNDIWCPISKYTNNQEVKEDREFDYNRQKSLDPENIKRFEEQMGVKAWNERKMG